MPNSCVSITPDPGLCALSQIEPTFPAQDGKGSGLGQPTPSPVFSTETRWVQLLIGQVWVLHSEMVHPLASHSTCQFRASRDVASHVKLSSSSYVSIFGHGPPGDEVVLDELSHFLHTSSSDSKKEEEPGWGNVIPVALLPIWWRSFGKRTGVSQGGLGMIWFGFWGDPQICLCKVGSQERQHEGSLGRYEVCLRANDALLMMSEGSMTIHCVLGLREAWERSGVHGFPDSTIWRYIPSLVSVYSLPTGTNHRHLTEWLWTPK